MSILPAPLREQPRQVLFGGQTMKCTHIGLEDQAKALAGLPAPFALAASDWLRIGRASGGALGHGMSPNVSGGIGRHGRENDKRPAGRILTWRSGGAHGYSA
jgi:hypothetical protein